MTSFEIYEIFKNTYFVVYLKPANNTSLCIFGYVEKRLVQKACIKNYDVTGCAINIYNTHIVIISRSKENQFCQLI